MAALIFIAITNVCENTCLSFWFAVDMKLSLSNNNMINNKLVRTIRDLFHVFLNYVKIIVHFLIYKPGMKV